MVTPPVLDSAVSSMDRFSTPSPCTGVTLAQNAPGDCPEDQFGIMIGGVMVTVFPLTLVTRTNCCWARRGRVKACPPCPAQIVMVAQTKMLPLSAGVPLHGFPLVPVSHWSSTRIELV